MPLYDKFHDLRTVNTFDDVAARYANTKPLGSRSTLHGLNVRPLVGRRYIDERIVQVSETCYLMTDWSTLHEASPNLYAQVREDMPDASWQDVWSEQRRRVHAVDPEKLVPHAPLVWRRTPDGDTVTVNGGGGAHTRNAMFVWALPSGLRLRLTASQPRCVTCGGVEHPLPHGAVLTFRQATPGGAWQHVAGEYKHPRRRINREVKAEYVTAIKAFRKWFDAVGPVMPESPEMLSPHDARAALLNEEAWVQLAQVIRFEMRVREEDRANYFDTRTAETPPWSREVNTIINRICKFTHYTTDY